VRADSAGTQGSLILCQSNLLVGKLSLLGTNRAPFNSKLCLLLKNSKVF
jgi:hypothetical protein